jgi:hypothetical protein
MAGSSQLSLHDHVGNNSDGACYLYPKSSGQLLEKHG